MMSGGFWDMIHPGVFLMETGMMKGSKERAEQMAQSAEKPALSTEVNG